MTYMTKEEIWAAALRQSAVDLNCSPEDFGREHSVVVRSAPHAGARKYLSLPFFCDLVSYGGFRRARGRGSRAGLCGAVCARALL